MFSNAIECRDFYIRLRFKRRYVYVITLEAVPTSSFLISLFSLYMVTYSVLVNRCNYYTTSYCLAVTVQTCMFGISPHLCAVW